jgi:hypothetical protein
LKLESKAPLARLRPSNAKDQYVYDVEQSIASGAYIDDDEVDIDAPYEDDKSTDDKDNPDCKDCDGCADDEPDTLTAVHIVFKTGDTIVLYNVFDVEYDEIVLTVVTLDGFFNIPMCDVKIWHEGENSNPVTPKVQDGSIVMTGNMVVN